MFDDAYIESENQVIEHSLKISNSKGGIISLKMFTLNLT